MRAHVFAIVLFWVSPALAQVEATVTPEGTGAAAPCWLERVTVYFDYDESVLRSDQTGVLDELAACLVSVEDDASVRFAVAISGHTDERGTEEYNFALGDRYANSVQRYLERQLPEAVSARIELRARSYGESQPLCAAHTEACWRRNRRAEIRVEVSAAQPPSETP